MPDFSIQEHADEVHLDDADLRLQRRDGHGAEAPDARVRHHHVDPAQGGGGSGHGSIERGLIGDVALEPGVAFSEVRGQGGQPLRLHISRMSEPMRTIGRRHTCKLIHINSRSITVSILRPRPPPAAHTHQSDQAEPYGDSASAPRPSGAGA